jgi:hypothetical protein
MQRRVLKRKEADRALWVTLFTLIVLGVAVAMWLTAKAEKKRVGRTGDLAPTEFVENPAASRQPDSFVSPATPAPAAEPTIHPDPAKPAAITTPAAPVSAHAMAVTTETVVALFTTPQSPTIAAMTPGCRDAIRSKGPWSDPQSGRTWPECMDGGGNPMVVQFCTYARLTSGEWVLSENNRSAPRCQTEFPLVRAGKLKSVRTRWRR